MPSDAGLGYFVSVHLLSFDYLLFLLSVNLGCLIIAKKSSFQQGPKRCVESRGRGRHSQRCVYDILQVFEDMFLWVGALH